MDNNIIFIIITVTILTFIYGYIAYSIARSTTRKQIQKDKEMIEMEQKEYQCFICRNKFESVEIFENNHPLCSEKCVAIYVDHGFNIEENNSMWANIYQSKIKGS